MNKQATKLKKRLITPAQKQNVSRAHLPWILFIAGFIIVGAFIAATAVRAQIMQANLAGGDVVEVLCEGRGFQIERVSRTELRLNCQAAPGSTNPIPTESPPPTTEPPPPTTEPPPAGTPIAAGCQTTTGFVPLNDLGAGSYQGFQGGLYANGSNIAPASYFDRAIAAANNINTDEEYVLLSIGMSNTMREFGTFVEQVNTHPEKNPNLVVLNGAQSGQDSVSIANPTADYWNIIDDILGQRRLDREDVRIVWLKEAHARPDLPFPQDAQQLQSELSQIVDNLNAFYPNLEIVYLSSRIYAGYATNDLNPEPYAYQTGFAVKWLIEEKMNDANYGGAALLWGPYMWADGLTPRSDGLTWACEDYRNDMTHPGDLGKQKVTDMLLNFFTTDSTAIWFRN